MSKSVYEATVRVLFESGAGKDITIYHPQERRERWAIFFKVGDEKFVVASNREDVRTWASLNSAVRWLKGFGISEAVLEIT
jgi:hypothetical protein